MKLCGVVITYYPDSSVVDNILRYLPWVDHLIVWENTPSEDLDKYKLIFPEKYHSKITILSNGKNEGIAKPLNESALWAINNGYTLLLTMDQDSQWENFEEYRQSIEANYSDNIAAFVPEVYDATRRSFGFNSIKQFITSGAVYNLTTLKDMGYFCEEFMIDCVDTEYSFRLRLNNKNWKILANCVLVQNFGNIKKVPILNSFHANYSPFRLYHIMRNNIWMWRMYRKTGITNKNFFRKDILFNFIIREPILIIFVGKRKYEHLKALLRGLKDGLFKFPPALNKYIR